MMTKLSGSTKIRLWLVCLFSVLTLPLSAQTGSLELISDETKVCGGGGIFLTVKGATYGNYLLYQEKHDDGEWKDASSSVTLKTSFGTSMPVDVDYVYYRVIDDKTKEISNVVTVERDKSKECSKICHTTSTGDQFTGTDFDPACPQPSIPNCVISHFNDYDITFDKAGEGGIGDNYVITNDLLSFLGQTPSLDQAANVSGKNYYYTMENPNGAICMISFSPFAENVLGSPYKYHMRLYIQFNPNAKKGDCTNLKSAWGNASIIARTYFGMQTNDYLEAVAYDDKSGSVLTQNGKFSRQIGSDVARVYLRELMNLDTVSPNRLIRLEVTYYGWFPDDRNGLNAFPFVPTFEQFDCSKVAVDYISADIASVCMSANPVCVGEEASIQAIGFPKESEYVWEYQNEGGQWVPVIVNGQAFRGPDATDLRIKATDVGKTMYRVYDEKTIWKTQNYKEFTVISKACTPPCPDFFTGPAKFCIPNDTDIVISPYPATTNYDDYRYEWVLLNMDGDTVDAPGVLTVPNAQESYKVVFKANESLPEGKYKVACRLFQISEGLHHLLCDTANEVMVYHRPSALFEVAKGGEAQTICPYSQDVQFTAKYKDNRYTYVWENAQGLTSDPSIAKVQVPANHCDIATFDAKLIEAFADFTACADTQAITFKIDKTQPVIDCAALGSDTTYYAAPTAVSAPVTLPVPVVTETCDGNPTIEINGKGKQANGSDFSFNITSLLSDIKAGKTNMVVDIPVTAGMDLSNRNGIMVTYVAKDGCGKPSEPCSLLVIVRDTSPAVLPCDLIPNYTDSLSHYPFDQCVATPGQGNPLLLPYLSAPTLEDQLHPGTYITGVMESRSDGKTDLNDPYAIGATTITWLFLDDAKNKSYCKQVITVIDDKKPEVKCPDINKFRVHPDSKQCTVSADSLIDQIKAQLGTDLPVATDRCENGVELQPTYYYQKEGESVWHPLESADKFELKITYKLQWRFYKPAGEFVDQTVYAFCEQTFNVIDDKTPEFDCNSIPDVTDIVAEKGKCEVNLADLKDIVKPWPYAKETCTQDLIEGVISLPDGSPLPATLAAGDTLDVIWTFKDTDLTDSVKICYKKLHAQADSEPIFDCSSLGLVVDTAKFGECEVDMEHLLAEQPWPTAKDSCTGNDIPGKPTQLDGSPLPKKIKVKDTLVIKWTFQDLNYSIGVKICTQSVTVIGSTPVDFDCSSLDTLHFPTVKGECYAIIKPGDIPIPEGEDFCTKDKIPGFPTRQDGGEVYGEYKVGVTMIDWHFYSPYSIDSSKTCPQPILVKTDKEMDAHCGKDSFPDIQIGVENGCQVPSNDVLSRLKKHFADHPCLDVKIPGVPSRSDGMSMNDPFPIDTIEIIWTFTDQTNTLLTPQTTCSQTVMISNMNPPIVDCGTSFPNSRLQMDTTNCSVDFKDIPVYLDTIPWNICNHEYAVVDTVRKSGLGMHEPYTLGEETIIWTFTFPSTNVKSVCEQLITVIDTVPPYFDCSSLQDVVAELLDYPENGYPYEKLVELEPGIKIPQAIDKCCDEVTTTSVRSDGKKLEDNYPFDPTKSADTTVITWIFTDCNGAAKQCQQNVIIRDMVPPVVNCPDLSSHLTCLEDTPTAWTTYDEFVLAGGSVVPEDRAFLNTFTHKDEVTGNECQSTVVRNYFLTTINGKIVSCEKPSVFDIKDDVPPMWVGINPSGEEHVTSCAEADTAAPKVTLQDNCDPNPQMAFQRISTQGSDPSECSYYTYDVKCTWWGVDRCGNQAEPVTYTVHVKDTLPPHVTVPDDWYADLHPNYLKKCVFAVPDITNLIPDTLIHDNCGDGYVRKWQEPAAGTVVHETTLLKLHIEDVCNNDTTLIKRLIIQPDSDIVKIKPAVSPVVCGDDESKLDPQSAKNSLHAESLRSATGYVYDFEDDKWEAVPATIKWDYYRGGVDPANLIYSDNVLTYAHLFESTITEYNATPEEKEAARNAFIKYLLLLRQNQSDYYSFVAMDTITGCSDTATIYVTVSERPRIELPSGPYSLCDGEALDIHGEFAQKFPVCIDDRGSDVYDQGWLLNGYKYYEGTPVVHDSGWVQTAVYYATNGCGTTTSQHTLFNHCSSDLPTAIDSLNFVGNSAEKFRLLKKDSLYTNDSVRITLFTRYEPSQVMLTTKPQDRARVYKGQEVTLNVTMPYDAAITKWMRVQNEFDGENNAIYNKYGEVVSGGSYEYDDVDLEREIFYQVHDTTAGDSSVYVPSVTVVRSFVAPNVVDTSYYYAVVGNGVCPAVVTNVVKVDIVKEIPTAITPYTKDGLNDDFMRGHHVIIYNRYGQMIFEGEDGWDGTYRGILVDPGVYFYNVDWQGGVSKGSVEVVKIE